MIKKVKNKYDLLPIQAKASMWFLFCSVLQKGMATITTPIFTRILTTVEYGQFNVFNSWMGIISVFLTMNLCSGVFMQGMVKFSDKRGEFSASLQGLMTTLVLIWTIIYAVSAEFWNNLFSLTTTQMLLMFALIWSTSVFSFWSSEQRIDSKYQKLVIVTIIFSIARPILGVTFVLLAEDKVTARILSMVIVNLIIYSGMFFMKIYKEKTFFSKSFWRYAFLFNLPLIPHYLSMTLLSSSDRIIINEIVGASAAGIYSLAYSISTLMTLFNNAMIKTVEPWLYKSINKKDFSKIPQITYPLFIMVAILNLLLIASAPEIILIFAPIEYYEAIWIMPPVAMSVFFMFTYSFFATFEFYYEKRIYIMLSTTIGAAANIILNYIFIDIFGYLAAGYTTLICYILYALSHYLFMRKICKDNLKGIKVYSAKIILAISAGFMLLGFSFLLTYSNFIIRYIYILILLVVCFAYRDKIKEFINTFMRIRKSKEN